MERPEPVCRLFSCTRDSAFKFWEVVLDGSRQTVRYGRIGTPGQTLVKSFPSPHAAQEATDKLIAQKCAKGYTETTPTILLALAPPRPQWNQLALPFDEPAPKTLALEF